MNAKDYVKFNFARVMDISKFESLQDMMRLLEDRGRSFYMISLPGDSISSADNHEYEV